MSEYSTNFNGEWLHVPDLNDCLKAIKCRNDDNEKRIKYLEEENKRLKDEAYKDIELNNMKEQLDNMKKDYWRGFPISEQEQEAIEKWKKKHDEEVHGFTTVKLRLKAGGCCGGRYTYRFVPTSIGISGKIICSCGAEFEFQGID